MCCLASMFTSQPNKLRHVLKFVFRIQGYRTLQTAHCALAGGCHHCLSKIYIKERGVGVYFGFCNKGCTQKALKILSNTDNIIIIIQQ